MSVSVYGRTMTNISCKQLCLTPHPEIGSEVIKLLPWLLQLETKNPSGAQGITYPLGEGVLITIIDWGGVSPRDQNISIKAY